MLALLILTPAYAYETDQLTGRDEPLADALPWANLAMDGVLAASIEATNERLECDASEERTRAVLAQEIHRRTAHEQPMMQKGLLRSPGYGRYQALLETGPVERREFLDRSDIFGELSLTESIVLRIAGTCSTVVLGGYWIGTDKLDHFFGEGFDYWRKSRDGADPEKAIRWGTRTEWSIYGLITSRTFSFADLAANHAGYEFYAGLLREGSVVQLDEDGCAAQVRPFDWSLHVSPDWDEVWNPSVHTPLVERGIARHLEAHKDEVCDSWSRWKTPEYEAHIAALDPAPPYVVEPVPPRTDPYRLAELCASPLADVDPAPIP